MGRRHAWNIQNIKIGHGCLFVHCFKRSSSQRFKKNQSQRWLWVYILIHWGNRVSIHTYDCRGASPRSNFELPAACFISRSYAWTKSGWKCSPQLKKRKICPWTSTEFNMELFYIQVSLWRGQYMVSNVNCNNACMLHSFASYFPKQIFKWVFHWFDRY